MSASTRAVFLMAINVHSLKKFNITQIILCHLRYLLKSCNLEIFSRMEETNFDWDVNIKKTKVLELITKYLISIFRDKGT